MTSSIDSESGAAATRRFLLKLQYLGTPFAGWQSQANAVGIQQIVEAALSTIAKSPVRLYSAGRTDAGVHAAALPAHIDLPAGLPAKAIILGGNNLLPREIRIISAEPVDSSFHARFDAKSKTYRYSIWNDDIADVFRSETAAHVAQPLDTNAMSRAAEGLVGYHDFKCFTVAGPEVSTTTRTIISIDVRRDGPLITIDVTADGFLRYMVRRIAGLLIEIGRRKLDENACARSVEPEFGSARWTAPAAGLTLLRVDY